MDWCRGQRLGHGSFAQVNLAVPTSCSSPLMAVKSCAASLSSSLLYEKFILEDLKDCPEIIRCHGDSYSCENGQKLYNVLLEYASGGCLADRVNLSGLPESQVRQYTKALLKGLHYIHKFGYVHCDIKLQNILVCSDGAVKIADFGLAKRADAASTRCDLRGTPMYMSPEMVAGSEQGAPADVWALGCVVAEMASGSPAWSCPDVAALLMRIGVGDEVPQIPGILSAEGKDFLEKCFAKDPRRRWTAEMLLNHPFVCGEEIDVRDALKDGEEKIPSTSPRCPLDFQDWATCSIISLPSPSHWNSNAWSASAVAERLRGLANATGHDSNWSVSDDWVTIR